VRPLSYLRAADVDSAVAAVRDDPTAAFLAGGTTEVDLLRLGIIGPDLLVDINDLPLDQVEDLPDGGVRIGALARMSDVARAPGIVERLPMISQALLLGASAQLRNMATMGGNLCQRVRCNYFRDGRSRCNKRDPGSGCAAIMGISRNHAVLGTSEHCIAVHPSDAAVALVALNAVVHTVGPAGSRVVPIDEFFLPPGDTPHREHALDHGELIVAIEVPGAEVARGSAYVKHRDRASYEFALVSVAAGVLVRDGTVVDARVALGGVATVPWRARRAEARIVGSPPDTATFTAAAEEELRQARPTEHNAFKVELARRAMVRALETVARGEAR
jgi:xanthine dehydrogenase YagS FAD-binding subunit